MDTGTTYKWQGKTYLVFHGDPFDRGSADSYYGRGRDPHRGGVGGNSGPRISTLTVREKQEYMAGYDYNEAMGDKKDWR